MGASSGSSTLDTFRILLTLAIGAAGGAVFDQLQVPLAWMIGAMVAVVVATLLGAPVHMHLYIRQPMIVILGVMLGSAFTPALAARIPEWWATIAGLAGYVLVTTALLFQYYRRLLGFDSVTAFCSATPGGLNEMVVVCHDLGGDDRLVALSHASRILLVVLVIPFAFTALGLYERSAPPPLGASLVGYPLDELGILAACGVVGYVAARWLRIPAAPVTGPMAVSAVVHLLGWSAAGPPGELIAAAQVVIGAAIGARFAGVAARLILRVLFYSVAATVLMIGITVGFALAFHQVVDARLAALVLGYAPGGLAEMSLIALALGIEAAFVATHHFARIAMIVIVAPALFRRRLRRKAADDTTADGSSSRNVDNRSD